MVFVTSILLICLVSALSETFLESKDLLIYHATPVLHVKVEGVDAHTLLPNLKLIIGAADRWPLKQDVDYSVGAGDGELVLKLLKNKM